MYTGLCRKCVRLEWSKVLYTCFDRSALGLLNEITSVGNRKFAYTKCSRVVTTTGPSRPNAEQHDDRSLLPHLGDEAVNEYDDESNYPMHLVDINHKKNWGNYFTDLKRQRNNNGTKPLNFDYGLKTHGERSEKVLSPGNDEYAKGSTVAGKGKCATQESNADATSQLDHMTAPTLNPEQLKKLNESVVSCIETQLRERLNSKCSVAVFGSAINGLWTDASDLDICVQIPNVTSRSATIRNLRRIAFLLEPLAPGRGFENRFTAKIPILHWKNEKSNKKSGNPVIQSLGCSIDISVNNVLAISNSALLGTYVACDPRVRSLVLALKLWARSRDLNDRSKGTLGSFALSIMVIHFLQRCTPPILVSLQDLAISDNEPPKYVSGIDVRFTTDMRRINEEHTWATKGVENRMNVTELLQEFFYYFGWIYTKNTQMPICIRSVDFQYMDNQFTFRHKSTGFDMDEKFMHVDNPFEIGIDVATISFHQRNRVIKEFRRAHSILKSGGSYNDILQD
ncbi:Terminal uridylyltransferase 7 [Babesia sp. Xinjiang]|uniref:Terminal uridylyltransferase 7 n=1 Tax=Babesia sp. Xinjiang TaxID=462227 RepID=UPI000A23BC22|nr:Terminal uridylyltransferase 7 [Babesia sp. Xinjiang]ORM40358.1 Terminal uridylyltransferase 7 [Babesia sp. Xinjiang]